MVTMMPPPLPTLVVPRTKCTIKPVDGFQGITMFTNTMVCSFTLVEVVGKDALIIVSFAASIIF